MHKLLIVSGDGDEYRRLIAAAEPRLEIRRFSDDAASREFAGDADILFAWKFDPGLLSQMGRLRWIQSTGAGVDHVMAAQPLRPGIMVTRMVDVFGPAMAEYVLGYMFAATLRVPHILALQRERRWSPFAAPLLRGKTAVVVGLGSIGLEVCRTLAAAGVNVIGASRTGRVNRGAIMTVSIEHLDDVLPKADFLVLVVPLTDQSRGFIDARRLALIPADAWLVNIGRGAVVDEAALIAALRQGTIGGAVLDVFEREPLPPESPLWSIENVIVTPHLSGPDDLDVIATRFLENYQRFKAGQPLEGVVDLERGY